MEEELKEYGLSEKEIKVYMSCLKAGSSTANRASELTGIRRSTVYEVMESLKKKGIISSFKKEKKYYFEAVKPAILLELLKEKEERVKRILPELNKLSKSLTEKPSVSLYEGKIGIRNAISEMLSSKEILVYGASKEGDRIFDTFPANFAQKRTEKKVMMKAIVEEELPEHMLDKKIKKYTQVRTLKSLADHKTAYFIYNNALLIITLEQEFVAIKIESPLLASSQCIIFDILWKVAKSR